jgi:hypothetical protein
MWCAWFGLNLPPCCHDSLLYIMGFWHYNRPCSKPYASRCQYCNHVGFVLFHDVTCYTDILCYLVSMLTLWTSLMSCALWFPRAWYWGSSSVACRILFPFFALWFSVHSLVPNELHRSIPFAFQIWRLSWGFRQVVLKSWGVMGFRTHFEKWAQQMMLTGWQSFVEFLYDFVLNFVNEQIWCGPTSMKPWMRREIVFFRSNPLWFQI